MQPCVKHVILLVLNVLVLLIRNVSLAHQDMYYIKENAHLIVLLKLTLAPSQTNVKLVN